MRAVTPKDRNRASSASLREELLPAVTAVVSFIDAINRGDVERLGELMTEDHHLDVFDEPPLRGKAANLDAWRGYASAFPAYVIYPAAPSAAWTSTHVRIDAVVLSWTARPGTVRHRYGVPTSGVRAISAVRLPSHFRRQGRDQEDRCSWLRRDGIVCVVAAVTAVITGAATEREVLVQTDRHRRHVHESSRGVEADRLDHPFGHGEGRRQGRGPARRRRQRHGRQQGSRDLPGRCAGDAGHEVAPGLDGDPDAHHHRAAAAGTGQAQPRRHALEVVPRLPQRRQGDVADARRASRRATPTTSRRTRPSRPRSSRSRSASGPTTSCCSTRSRCRSSATRARASTTRTPTSSCSATWSRRSPASR